MSERVHEEYEITNLLYPIHLQSGGNVTSDYKSILGIGDEMLFHIASAGSANSGSCLGNGKYLKFELFQASGSTGANPVEYAAAETIFTAPAEGCLSVDMLVSVNPDKLVDNKPWVAAKLTTDAAADILVFAEMLVEKRNRGAMNNILHDEVTVV